jgi:hypothetical protein
MRRHEPKRFKVSLIQQGYRVDMRAPQTSSNAMMVDVIIGSMSQENSLRWRNAMSGNVVAYDWLMAGMAFSIAKVRGVDPIKVFRLEGIQRSGLVDHNLHHRTVKGCIRDDKHKHSEYFRNQKRPYHFFIPNLVNMNRAAMLGGSHIPRQGFIYPELVGK